jgi:hypothetical protein
MSVFKVWCISEAVKKGDIDKVKSLCAELGSDLKFGLQKGFEVASYNGNLEFVKYFVSAGVDVNTNHDYAVQMASYYGHLEVVMYLLETGADIRNRNDCAIYLASLNDKLQVVQYLYENGADITRISEKHQKYILFCEKMKRKIRERAQKRIYFWWIPICYDVSRETGKRMMLKNLEKARELGMEFK